MEDNSRQRETSLLGSKMEKDTSIFKSTRLISLIKKKTNPKLPNLYSTPLKSVCEVYIKPSTSRRERHSRLTHKIDHITTHSLLCLRRHWEGNFNIMMTTKRKKMPQNKTPASYIPHFQFYFQMIWIKLALGHLKFFQ